MKAHTHTQSNTHANTHHTHTHHTHTHKHTNCCTRPLRTCRAASRLPGTPPPARIFKISKLQVSHFLCFSSFRVSRFRVSRDFDFQVLCLVQPRILRELRHLLGLNFSRDWVFCFRVFEFASRVEVFSFRVLELSRSQVSRFVFRVPGVGLASRLTQTPPPALVLTPLLKLTEVPLLL
jgi:hypothetical protein